MVTINEILEHRTAVGGVIAFIFGASFRLFDSFLKKNSDDTSLAQQIRGELRTELYKAHEIIDKQALEIEEWKTKYWTEKEAHFITKGVLMANEVVVPVSAAVIKVLDNT